MGESISAVTYILAGTLAMFAIAARIAAGIVDRETIRVWIGSWVAATVAVFLVRNFFAYGACLFVIALVSSRRLPPEERPFLFIVLMFTAPNLVIRMPGFAGINTLLDLTPQRILSAAILLPLLPALLRKAVPPRLKIVDTLVVCFVLLITVLTFRHSEATATDTVRRLITNVLEIGVPYFVFSRCLMTVGDIRKGYMALVFGTLSFPVIGVIEFLRQWRLFNVVAQGWGAEMVQFYLFRDGMLRSAGPAIEAIAFGFICMIAMGCMLSLMTREKRTMVVMGIFAAFAIGLVTSLSRGPWVGAAIMLVVYLLARPKAVSTGVQATLLGGLALVPVLMSPLGDKIIRYLPFVGTVENNNVEYRQQLIDNSMAIIGRHPIFGAAEFLNEPEMLVMRQGQGIIDVVNTYVALALEFGLLTLAIFLLIFVLTGLSVLPMAFRRDALAEPARQWLAIMAATMVTIATVSSVSYIPFIYWIMAGFGVGMVRMSTMGETAVGAMPHATGSPGMQGMRVIGTGAYAHSGAAAPATALSRTNDA